MLEAQNSGFFWRDSKCSQLVVLLLVYMSPSLIGK